MPTRRSPLSGTLALLQFVLGPGCSGAEETQGEVPPTWADAPEALTLGQGRSRTLPVEISRAGSGAVSIAATAEPPVLEVAVEGTTLTLHAGYDHAGPVALRVTLTGAEGAASEHTVTVEVTALGWQPPITWTAAGPEAREHAAVIVDEAARAAYVIGGSGYAPYLDPLDDVWRYDLDADTWAELLPGDTVPSGGSRRVAIDEAQRTAYLFGGYGTGGASHAELVRVRYGNGALAFETVPQSGAPSPRSLHAFVFDPVTERFYAFGGVGAGLFDDTYTMAITAGTAAWTRLDLSPRPSPRYGFFYGFDPATGLLTVFSGAQGTNPIDAARDTWQLDVRADPPRWALVAEGDPVPPGRRNGCAVFDPSGPRLVVFGGTPDAMNTSPGLFLFDARPGRTNWTHLQVAGEPPLRSSGFGLYDAARGRVLLGFGNTTTQVFQDWATLGYPPPKM